MKLRPRKDCKKSIFNGKSFKRLRKSKGLTLQDICDELRKISSGKPSTGMVSRWQNGLAMPRMETVHFLADILKVDIIELLDVDAPLDTAIITEETENVEFENDISKLLSSNLVKYKGRTLASFEVEKVKKILELVLE